MVTQAESLLLQKGGKNKRANWSQNHNETINKQSSSLKTKNKEKNDV